MEDSQNKLRVPPAATRRCCRSSSGDKEEGRNAPPLTSEFQMVNNFQGTFNHVMYNSFLQSKLY